MRSQKKKTQVWRPHEENFGSQKDILALNSDQGGILGSYCWPAGFWADTSYMIDTPIILNKNDPGYNFEQKVRSFYEGMISYFETEKTNHAYRPFGCDMAFIEASINYRIVDSLIATWNRLGFNETIELMYSTPTRYISEIKNVNNNEWKNTTKSWSIRRDDTFPYAQNPQQYWNGFFTSRPHIKKNIRDLTTTLHSSQRLISQQVLRTDLNDTEKHSLLQYQTNVLDQLGNMMHHDAITGTSTAKVMGDFNDRATEFRGRVLDMNAKYLREKIEQHHGIKVNNLQGTLDYYQTWKSLVSPFSHYTELLFVVQNPSQQLREEFMEVQLPYYNYTIFEVVNGTEVEVKNFDKYLPRTWLNSNRTIVKSYAQLLANFTDTHELTKLYIVKNKGVLHQHNYPPASYKGHAEIWNLNLPIFL